MSENNRLVMGEIKDLSLALCPGNWNPMNSEVAFEKGILNIIFLNIILKYNLHLSCKRTGKLKTREEFSPLSPHLFYQ